MNDILVHNEFTDEFVLILNFFSGRNLPSQYGLYKKLTGKKRSDFDVKYCFTPSGDAELYKKNDIKALQKVTQQSTKLIFWTTLPLVVIFMLCSDFLMGLFGEEFKVGVFVFIVLSFGRIVVSFSGAAGNLLQMCGRQVIFMNVAIIGSIINITLNFSLIPIYGINGSAIATMVSIVVFNLLLVYFVKREFGFYTFYIPFQKNNRL